MDKLVCVQDFEEEALRLLPKNAGEYFKGGSDDEITLKRNGESYNHWLIRPRMLRDVTNRNLKKIVQKKPVQFPVGFSPVGFQCLSHEQGEVASAKAACENGTVFVLSTYGTRNIEDIGKACPTGRNWFQLFPNSDENVSVDLLKRAERAGFEAIVVTLDAQTFGNKRKTARTGFYLPSHIKIANLDKYMKSSGGSDDLVAHTRNTLAQNITWDIIPFVRRHTKLPLILKGIITVEDAKLAVQHKVDGIWVSNHGGRQVDTAPQPIEVLPGIVAAVKGQCEIYIDSGVRRGSDVFKALALGATMAFLGRPQVWGIAVGGQAGASKILNIVRDELDMTMALSGVADVNKIGRELVCRSSEMNSKL